MAIIQAAAFIIAVLLSAYLFRESFVNVLPGAVCGLVLLLYVLALCRHLSLIDYLAVFLPAGTLLWLLAGKRRDVLQYWRALISEPSFIVSISMIFLVALCVLDKRVTWWDDINFWAADVKSLYYLDGFAQKYGNVAPEFGDYPPGAQLFKWWFLHLDRHTFREGLAFAGYHVMNLTFLFPLLTPLDKLAKKEKKSFPAIVLAAVLLAAALWFFPGIAEIYGYHGFCADLTMACIYGSFLFAVTDRDGHKESFYRARLILYPSVLVLVKSVGFIWAAFGLVFLCCWRLWIGRQEPQASQSEGSASFSGRISADGPAAQEALTSQPESSASFSGRLFAVSVVAAPLLSGGSWMLFCLLMRRVTKTTTTAVKYLTTSEYTWSLYRNEFARAFVRALFTEPLHKGRTWAVDLSPCGFYLLIVLLAFAFYKNKMLPKKQSIFFLCFSLISGAVMYAVIFVSHLTLFANETQYLEPAAMVSSIERYGAPFTVGTLLFFSLLWMQGARAAAGRVISFMRGYGAIACFVLLVFLTTEWQDGYDGLIGYRRERDAALQEREAMTDERSRCFLSAIAPLDTRQSTRVLCLQNDVSERWVRNSYTNFAASPVSVIYLHTDLSGATDDILEGIIRSGHAAYLYADQPGADTDALLRGAVKNGSFRAQTLYKIEDNGTEIHLTEVQ